MLHILYFTVEISFLYRKEQVVNRKQEICLFLIKMSSQIKEIIFSGNDLIV